MFVQLFEGWRYRPGVRDRIVAMGLADTALDAPRPDIPGLVARLLATDPNDGDTGIGLWVWQDEAACRAYEAGRPTAVQETLQRDIDESAITERVFDALMFGARVQPG